MNQPILNDPLFYNSLLQSLNINAFEMPQNNVFTINDKKYYINSEIIDKNEVEIDDVEEPESKTLKRKNDVDDAVT